MILYTLFAMQAGAFPDAAIFASCKRDGDYGKQRLWCSIGWGLFSFLGGVIVQQAGIHAT